MMRRGATAMPACRQCLIGMASIAAACVAAIPASAQQADIATVARRDLSGVWWITDYTPQLRPAGGGTIPFTPAGKAAFDKNQALRKAGALVDVGLTKCLPEGTTRTLFAPYPMQIVQHGGYVTFVHEVNHVFWSASLTESHPKGDDLDPAFMGDSTAKWYSDTLIVDTVGFKDSFLDDAALPHGAGLHVVTRFHLSSPDTLEVVATITDPEFFRTPFTVRHSYERRSDVALQEFVCREDHRVLTGSRAAGVQLKWVAK